MADRFVKIDVKMRLTYAGVTAQTDDELRAAFAAWAERARVQNGMHGVDVNVTIEAQPMPKETAEMLKHAKEKGYGG